MPQINLLGQDAKRYSEQFAKGPLYAIRFFVFFFVVLICVWGFLFVRTRVITGKVMSTRAEVISQQNKILSDSRRRELLVKQGQLDSANRLLASHEYWSKLLPELARVTVKTASYISFFAEENGEAHLKVTVPTYKDFDLFLQVFDLPEFSNVFSHVSVSSVGKYLQGNTQSVRFDVVLKYNDEFLKTVNKEPTNNQPTQ